MNLKIKEYNLSDKRSKKEYNEKLFDIVAPKYDAVTVVLSFGRDGAWKKKLADGLPEINAPVCLDLACGTGDLITSLMKKYESPLIIGLDLNETMLQLSKKRFDKFENNISLEKGDMADIKKNDDTFDVVTGGYALRNAPDIKKTLEEIYRVTKKGGFCSFLDFSKSRNKFLSTIQLFFLKLWGSIWGILFHGNHEIYGYIADSLKLFPDRMTLRNMLEKIGFVDIRSKLLFFGFIEIISFRKLM